VLRPHHKSIGQLSKLILKSIKHVKKTNLQSILELAVPVKTTANTQNQKFIWLLYTFRQHVAEVLESNYRNGMSWKGGIVGLEPRVRSTALKMISR